MNIFLILLIKFYKFFLSPFLIKSCRFYPTCSTYALEVSRKYNFFKSVYLISSRLIRCNQFFKGGYDPS